MKKFDIDEGHNPSDSLGDYLEKSFGEYETDGEWLVVEKPNQDVLEKVSAKITEDKLHLDIEEVDVDKVVEDNMDTAVKSAIKAKNNFLKSVTGFSVSERKKRIRSDVLPDKEWIDNNWVDSFQQE